MSNVMVRIFVLLGLVSLSTVGNAASTEDCKKSLSILDAAMQLEDVKLDPGDQLEAVIEECRATWPRYRGYITCTKAAKGHEELMLCISSWQKKLRVMRLEEAAAGPKPPAAAPAVVPGGTMQPVSGSLVPYNRMSVELELRGIPKGLCLFDTRFFSPGSVVIMPGDGQAYVCGRHNDYPRVVWSRLAQPPSE